MEWVIGILIATWLLSATKADEYDESAVRKSEMKSIDRRHKENKRKLRRIRRKLGRDGYPQALAEEETRYLTEIDRWFG